MTKEKYEDLLNRMRNHTVKDDVAVVELTAKELQELLIIVGEILGYCSYADFFN